MKYKLVLASVSYKANLEKIVNNTHLNNHIFKGNVKPLKNPDGTPRLNAEGNQVYTTSGVHSKVAIDSGTARIKTGTKIPENAGIDDFYKAKVEIKTPDGNWKTKKNKSTFFPDSWSKEKIQGEIAYAMINKKSIGTNKYEGTMSNGVKIEFYIKNGTVETAYPVLP